MVFRQKNRLEKTGQNFSLSRVIFYFLLPIFLAVSVYILVFSNFLKISQIEIEGNKDLASSDVSRKVSLEISGKYLKFFPKDNLILASKRKLEESIREEFRKIESVEIAKKFPGTLIIRIEERSSVILWCSGGPCYIVDGKGYVYTGINLEEEDKIPPDLIKLVDRSAHPVNLREKVLDESFVSYLSDLREEIKKSDLEIEDEWSTPSPVSEDVEITAKDGWKLIFSSAVKASKAIRTLQAFLSEELKSGDKDRLEYVDLRAEDKVFYKLREDESEN